MASSKNDILFKFVGDTKSLDRATRGASKSMGKAQSSSLNLTKAMGALGLAFGAQQILAFGKSSIDAASDYEEAVNAIEVASGDASKGIIEFGDTAAEAIGLSETAVLDAAVAFSGFADKIATDQSVEDTFADYITRVSDFGSVMNLTTDDSLAKFQSALAGESEPLRRFGIDVSAAAVAAFALDNGITAVGETMSEDDKVLARYGLLMAETSKFANDFANTSDSAANAQKILNAQLANAQVEIGQKLLPVWADLLSVAIEFTPVLGLAADGMAAFTEQLGPFAEGLSGAADSSADTRSRLDAAKDAVFAWGHAIAKWSPSSFLLVRGLEAVKDEAAGTKTSIEKAEDGVKRLGTEMDTQSPSVDGYWLGIKKVAETSGDAAEETQNLNDALREGLDPVRDAVGSYQNLQETLADVDEDGERSADELLKVADAVLEVQGKFDSLTEDNITDAVDAVSSALGISGSKARDLLIELGLIDGKNVRANVNVAFTYSNVVGGINRLGGLIEGNRAHGGPVSGGRPYLVGEEGPEVVVPGRSGTVIPNGASSGGGGGTVVNITVNSLDPDAAAVAVADALRSYTDRYGPL